MLLFGRLFALFFVVIGGVVATQAREGVESVAGGLCVAAAGVGGLLCSARNKHISTLGGVLIGLALYAGFTGVGASMLLDPAAAVASDEPGGRGWDLDDNGDAIAMGVFFVLLANIPAVLVVGGTISARRKSREDVETAEAGPEVQ